MSPQLRSDHVAQAKLLLVALSFAWGLNWPAIKIGLEDFTPWSYRLWGFSIGAAVLVVLVKLQGRSLHVPRGPVWLHIVVSSWLNIVAFGLFSTFAQLTASTSRVAVVTYSFPVWASLLAWLVLGERLTRNAVAGLVLCIVGLAVLIYPVLETQALIGLGLSIACAITWAIATIYLKLTRLSGGLVITTWQIVVAFATMVVIFPIVQGLPTFEPATMRSTLAVIFSGLVGAALAYVMWYRIIEHLPTSTASIGTLAVPVVGVVSSALILGERPSTMDWIGFSLIFAAAACVIVQPRRRAVAPRPVVADPERH